MECYCKKCRRCGLVTVIRRRKKGKEAIGWKSGDLLYTMAKYFVKLPPGKTCTSVNVPIALGRIVGKVTYS